MLKRDWCKQSPLNDFIPNLIPRILLSQMIIKFFSGDSKCAFHITAILISVLNFASDVNNVVLISRITVSIIIAALCDLLPYLWLGSRLVCCSYVLHLLKTSHVSKIVFQVRRVSFTFEEHVGHHTQHVLDHDRSYVCQFWVFLSRPLFPHLKFVMHEHKSHDTACQWRRAQLCELVERKLSRKGTVAAVFSSPKGFWKHKVKPCHWPVLLVLENHLLAGRYFWNLDLTGDCHWNWKQNFHTRELLSIFEFDNNILSKLINDLSDRRIQLQDVRPVVLRLIFLQYLEDIVFHLINQGHHPIFNFKSINVIIHLLTIQPEQFHTAVIIDQLKNREFIATDAFQGFHFVHYNVGEFLVFDFLTNVLRDCDVVVVLYVLIEQSALSRGVVGVAHFLHVQGQVLYFVHQSYHLLLVFFVKFRQCLHPLILFLVYSVNHQAVAVLRKQWNFVVLHHLQNECMLFWDPCSTDFDRGVYYFFRNPLFLGYFFYLYNILKFFSPNSASEGIWSLKKNKVSVVLGKNQSSLKPSDTASDDDKFMVLRFFLFWCGH